jgi:hypothetical protein
MLYARMVATKPHRFIKFLDECFSSDDLVAGKATGNIASPVIVMTDRPTARPARHRPARQRSPAMTGKRSRQTKITEFFINKRFRLIKTKITDYF